MKPDIITKVINAIPQLIKIGFAVRDAVIRRRIARERVRQRAQDDRVLEALREKRKA